MFKTRNTLFTIAIILLAGLTSYNYKHIKTSKKGFMDKSSKSVKFDAQFEENLKKYLLENPEVILQSVNDYTIRMQEEQKKQAVDMLKNNYDKVYSENSFTIGNPEGSINIVEFFDYNCGYCKQISPLLKELAVKNPNVKIYMKDIPILGPTSVDAAKASIAAGLLGKYEEFHMLLMKEKNLNEDTFKKVAKEVKIKPNDLIEMMGSEKVSEILMENRFAASLVGLQGTPTIFVETTQFEGVPTIASLEAVIREELEAKLSK